MYILPAPAVTFSEKFITILLSNATFVPLSDGVIETTVGGASLAWKIKFAPPETEPDLLIISKSPSLSVSIV